VEARSGAYSVHFTGRAHFSAGCGFCAVAEFSSTTAKLLSIGCGCQVRATHSRNQAPLSRRHRDCMHGTPTALTRHIERLSAGFSVLRRHGSGQTAGASLGRTPARRWASAFITVTRFPARYGLGTPRCRHHANSFTKTLARCADGLSPAGDRAPHRVWRTHPLRRHWRFTLRLPGIFAHRGFVPPQHSSDGRHAGATV
jgi:hypothetical protein